MSARPISMFFAVSRRASLMLLLQNGCCWSAIAAWTCTCGVATGSSPSAPFAGCFALSILKKALRGSASVSVGAELHFLSARTSAAASIPARLSVSRKNMRASVDVLQISMWPAAPDDAEQPARFRRGRPAAVEGRSLLSHPADTLTLSLEALLWSARSITAAHCLELLKATIPSSIIKRFTYRKWVCWA